MMEKYDSFTDAVALRKDEWDTFKATMRGDGWMMPIADQSFDEDFASPSGVSERQLDAHLDRAAKRMPRERMSSRLGQTTAYV